MTVRIVIVMQLAIVALAGWAARGSNWSSSPGLSEAPINLSTPLDEPPEWLSKAIATVMVVLWFTFPLWGVIAAWRCRLAPWKILASFLVGMILWFALFTALLPSVQ